MSGRKPAAKNSQFTIEQCQAFARDPTRNPATNAKIQIGKGTYEVLVRACAQYGIQIGGAVQNTQMPVLNMGQGFNIPGFNPPTQQFQLPGQGQLGGQFAPTQGQQLQLPGQQLQLPGQQLQLPGQTAPTQGQLQLPGQTMGGFTGQQQLPSLIGGGAFTNQLPPLPQQNMGGFVGQQLPKSNVGGFVQQQQTTGPLTNLVGQIGTLPITTTAQTALPQADLPKGPSVLIIVHHSDSTLKYLLPRSDPEALELIQQYTTVDQKTLGIDQLTPEQSQLIENADFSLTVFEVKGSITGVNIDTVISFSIENDELDEIDNSLANLTGQLGNMALNNMAPVNAPANNYSSVLGGNDMSKYFPELQGDEGEGEGEGEGESDEEYF